MDYVGLGVYWDDLKIGQTFRTINRTVTEADLIGFINTTGMVGVAFADATFSEQHGAAQGQRPVPAALAYTFAEGLLTQAAMQMTDLGTQEVELKVVSPSNVGDTIHVDVEVLALRGMGKGNRGLVTTRNKVVNQRDETVLEYTITRVMAGRPESG